MSNNQIEVPSTGRAGQSTQVEQARAMADVYAAMATARDNPRSTTLARDRMQDACSQMALAEHAFFRFNRGGSQVSGPTVHLARELARCYGNMRYGIKELYRNDLALESEMLAYAEDLEANIRTENAFIVPHKRDAGGTTVPLLTMRDVYESNANAGARRVRECIYAVLPLWFRKEAETLCLATLEKGDGVPLQVRKDKAIDAFGRKGIRIVQLEEKLGTSEGRWRAVDVATLAVIWKSLEANETTVEDEFPTTFTRADDIAGPVGPDTLTAVTDAPPSGPVETTQWADVAAPKTSAAGTPVPPDYVCDVCTMKGDHLQYSDDCPGPADGT